VADEQHEQSPRPKTVGNLLAQQRFIQRHSAFLTEYPKIAELCEKVFNRTLVPPGAIEYQQLLVQNPKEDDPAVIAWEERLTASYLIFQLGIMAADDFTTVLLLTGNGAGFASFIHLRSIYERLVHAMYMALRTSEALVFADSSPINKLNYLTRLVKFIPALKQRYDDAFMEQLRKDAEVSRAARKQSICSKCKQPTTQHAWTRVSLDSMACEVDRTLGELYGVIYLEGTNQAHANSMGMERRLEEIEGGYRYKALSENEAAVALRYAHYLMLRLLMMQDDHFGLGLNKGIQERMAKFEQVWLPEPTTDQSGGAV